jgi:acetamidase/formamidase
MNKFLETNVDNEIYELSELIDILTDDDSIKDSDNLSLDVKIMKARITAFKDVKNMMVKAAIGNDALDSEKIMTKEELKWFYRLMKIIRFFRKIFRIK